MTTKSAILPLVASLAAASWSLVACGERPGEAEERAATSDWRELRFSDCCIVQHPRDLLVQPQRGGPVRNDFAALTRPGLQVYLEFQPAEFEPNASAIAPPDRAQWRQKQIEVEGHDGRVIRDASEAPGFEGGESLRALIVLRDQLRDPLTRPAEDGRGMQLSIAANCRSEADCAVVDLMISTLDFPPLRPVG